MKIKNHGIVVIINIISPEIPIFSYKEFYRNKSEAK